MFASVCAPLSVVLILLLGESRPVCGRSSDICDWVGSGLHSGIERGIQPLYLRCTQGRIKWHYPRGALRALLTPPLARFEGCVRISPHSSGARLYLEGDKKLYQLYRPGDGRDTGLPRCFTSKKGQVALYLEADPPVDLLRKDTVEFSYDLVPKENLADDMEECRPCSEEEMLKTYCTADFVVQGTVASLAHNHATEMSELTVQVSKVVRDTPASKWRDSKHVTLHRPLKCGTKVGKGEFVFFGRFRLGVPMAVCAPRLVQWKEIRRKALVDRTYQCQLD